VVSARAALLVAALLVMPARARAEDAGVLDVRIALDREQVFVHEQVVLSLIVHHAIDARASWEPPPFDGFWAERLGTRALPSDTAGANVTEFRRALFPTRAGDVAIAPSKLVLVGEAGSEREFPVPATRIRVVPLPADLPADTLVGQLEVHVTTNDDQVRLGKSLAVTVELTGEGNVWDATPPALEPLLGPGVEVFPEAPRLSIGEGGGRATTRRTFRYALVPSSVGAMDLQPVRFAFFDPRARALASAASEPLAFAVVEGGPDERTPWQNRPRSREAAPLPIDRLALVAAAVVVSAFAAFLLWRLTRRPRLSAAAVPEPRAAFDAALAARDTSACLPLLARAVRAGIHTRHGIDALPLTTDEIAARVPDREALELLTALDRARFAGDGRADALLDRVRAYLRL
jgi:hypothetical protein